MWVKSDTRESKGVSRPAELILLSQMVLSTNKMHLVGLCHLKTSNLAKVIIVFDFEM